MLVPWHCFRHRLNKVLIFLKLFLPFSLRHCNRRGMDQTTCVEHTIHRLGSKTTRSTGWGPTPSQLFLVQSSAGSCFTWCCSWMGGESSVAKFHGGSPLCRVQGKHLGKTPASSGIKISNLILFSLHLNIFSLHFVVACEWPS